MTSDCPSAKALLEFASGQSPAERTRTLAAHLDGCARCQSLLDELTAARSLRQQVRRYSAASADIAPSPSEAVLIERLIRAGSSIRREGLAPATTATEDAPLRPTLPCGFGPYRLLALIGRSASGETYRAMDPRRDRPAALKLFRTGWASDDARRQQFQHEIRRAAELQHPHLAAPRETGEFGGTFFVESEFVDGVGLDRAARVHRGLALADACECVRQAALGLDYAHAEGIVHANVKPSNVLIGGEGRVRVADFGSAALRPPASAASIGSGAWSAAALDYLAPEQAASGSAGSGTDSYALGCVLFRLIAGRPPFHGRQYDAPIARLFGHLNERPPRLDSLCPDLPPEVVSLVDRLLAKEPCDRPQSAADVAQTLAPYSAGANLAALAASLG